MVNLEVVYVDELGQTFHQRLSLEQGATIALALEESELFQKHPETRQMPVGIFGKQAALETVLQEGDRVEIYRPLSLDPKEKRRKLATIKKI